MSEVIIIHDSEDADRAALLSAALGAAGVRLWPGFDFAPERARPALVRAAIERSAAVLVVWSPRAIVSDAIVDAAGHAAAQGKLSALAFEAVRPPPAFMGWAIADFSTWNGELEDGPFQEVMSQVEARRTAFLPSDEGAKRARDRELNEDLRDLRRALQKGGQSGWRDYLRRQPDGVFAIVAGEQLQAPPAYVSPPELAQMDSGEEDHWQYAEAPLGERVKAWMSAPAWRWGAGFAVFALALVLGVQYVSPPSQRSLDSPDSMAAAPGSASAPERNDAAFVAPTTPQPPAFDRGAPPQAHAALPPQQRQRAQNAAASADQSLARASNSSQSLGVADPTPGADEAGGVLAQAASENVERPRTRLAAAAFDPPLQGAPFDRLALDRQMREAVERARRAEARARTEAARNRGEDASWQSAAADGIQYQGERLDRSGVARGLGVFASGARYVGEWRSGAPEGWGVLIYADGLRYEGEFADGRPTGRGVLWSASGARIVGEAQFARLMRRLA